MRTTPLNTSVLIAFCALLCPGIANASELSGRGDSSAVPDGNGQLENPPQMFRGGIDEGGHEFFLNGQPSSNGKLILTASNGFFDSGCCRAGGESTLPKVGDESLIKPNYGFLHQWKKINATIRWHVWISEPGKLRLNMNIGVTKSEAGSTVMVNVGGESQLVTTVESLPGQPQPWGLEFHVATPGQHTIELSAQKIANTTSGVGELHTIDLFGPAARKSQLLRARWRPAAVHARYSCSTLGQSNAWVMTTRSTCDFSSYSPITTPFGYFGTSFEADRRVKGGFNFSMWAASARGKIPPLNQMPHLLAAGSPSAEFSGFGHEGSGVKLRGWIPMPDRPEVCVQALRVESEGSYDTYHGYFWDHPARRWKLYAVGRKWNGGKAKPHLSPGSFCEVPGPPNVQRSGDRVREVRRRGWHLSDDGKWIAMDTFECKSKEPMNKFWVTTTEGEFAMLTGGMRYHKFAQPGKSAALARQPAFLTPEATSQLYRLPARIDQVKVVQADSTSATVNVLMTDAGTGASATLHYGESDSLTFAKRKLHGTERNSAVSKSTQASDRSWSNAVKIENLKTGKNLVRVDGLSPNKTYFCRALVTNDEGKIWSFESQQFHTSR